MDDIPVYDVTDTPPLLRNNRKNLDQTDRPRLDQGTVVDAQPEDELKKLKISNAETEEIISVKNGEVSQKVQVDERKNSMEIANNDHLFNTDEEPTVEMNTTDNPFSRVFVKPSQPIHQLKNKNERRDVEGILFKHTTFYPKQPEKNISYFNYELNSDFYYDMDTFPRGRLTILNVKHFQRASGMSEYPRHGTDVDAQGLCDTFLNLGFIVDRYDNPSRKDMLNILKVAANEDYSQLSCCACAILTHGEEGILYGTDDYIKIKDVTKLFRARTLAGKPKIFIFQACQGSEYMDPLDSVDGPGSAKVKKDREMALTLPSESDFVYAYSTVPGYYSWRNSRNGSWFIESINSVFREHAHKMDVIRMLTRVNSVISSRKSRTDSKATDDKRQIASIITQMRKEFFLFPPYGPL